MQAGFRLHGALLRGLVQVRPWLERGFDFDLKSQIRNRKSQIPIRANPCKSVAHLPTIAPHQVQYKSFIL
jgi:hypothetical protein